MHPPRTIAITPIVFGLLLLAGSHYHYGLSSQSGFLLGIVPLLFAGLLLGRTGLWMTAAAYLVILIIGTWSDLRQGVAGIDTFGDALSSLLQPVMGSLIVTLILDRMILKSDISRRRSQSLALLYRQLEIEMQEKDRLQAQLIHSQRMDALGKLAGNVAHDFNNLLGVILGYAKLVQYDPNARQEQMTGIVNATRRGKQLTEKLMTLARANPPAREVFDANDAINGLLPMIRSIVGKRIDVVAMPCPQAAWIRMDVAEFEASVLNIAKNAGDAMTDEGTFRIEIDAVDHDVRLRFTDNGSGIPQDVVARVFEPFFTTKPATHGTGIGLAVVYRVISESGGRIDVSSASGQGTCFTMRLPLHEAPQFAGALPA